MMSCRLLRNIQCKKSNALMYKYLSQAYYSDSSDDEKKHKKKLSPSAGTKKSEDALKKLNLLLKKMVEEDHHAATVRRPELDLARPKLKTTSTKLKHESTSESADIIKAAKDVATSIGGDVKQTESELLSKLLSPNKKYDDTDSQNKSAMNLSDIIAGMKIDRTVKSNANIDVSKAHQVRQLLDRGETKRDLAYNDHQRMKRKMRPPPSKMNIEATDLFGSEPLGIFTDKSFKAEEEQKSLKTWDMLFNRELRLAVTHPPQNYFQELILWTKQGKIWKFPIDNEYGLDEEQNVYFAEHIFLEKHLEPWCPQRGPVRHFMELVCVGLSKNPYLGADAKRDHINWFKSYFLSKKQLLNEIGAMPTETKDNNKLDC